MNKWSIGLVFFSFFFFASTVSAIHNLSSRDMAVIDSKIQILVSAFNNKDKEIVSLSILSTEKALIDEIKEKIGENMNLQVEYSLVDGKSIEMENGDIKIRGKIFASAENWEISGFRVFFVLRQSGEDWFIVDTDLHEKLGGEYITSVVTKVFLITLPILFVYCALWIWMLIDCIKRDFKDKTLWIVLLILIPLSCIYYLFAVKRKNVIKESKRD